MTAPRIKGSAGGHEGASAAGAGDHEGGSAAEARVHDAGSAADQTVLVIGFGNELRADDGVGPAIAERLGSDPRAAGARVLAVRQLTPDLALDVASCSLVVLVDATVELEPGGIAIRELSETASRVRARQASDTAAGDRGARGPEARGPAAGDPGFRGPGIHDAGAAAFTHHVAPLALVDLAAALYGARPRVVVVSVGAASLAFGDGLSAEVAGAVPRAVDALVDLVNDHRIRAPSSEPEPVAQPPAAAPIAPRSGARRSTRPSGRSPRRSRA